MPRKVKDIQYDEFDPNFKKIVAREKILNNKEFCKDCKCFAANSKMCKTILQRNKCSRWKKYTKKYKNKCTHCGIIIKKK